MEVITKRNPAFTEAVEIILEASPNQDYTVFVPTTEVSNVNDYIYAGLIKPSEKAIIRMNSGIVAILRSDKRWLINGVPISSAFSTQGLMIYFIEGMLKPEVDTPWNRCIIDLKAKNTQWCADHKYEPYSVDPDGNQCYNPWAICNRSVTKR